mgnify:CR=1 FL=1|jgi:hypothetical protein
MTEFQIISQFNSFLISNAMYLAVFTFLLWMAFRGVIRLSENGGTIFNKVLSSLFSLTVVYFNLQTLGFLYANWQGTAYSLSQLDNLSPTAESFVNFVGGGSLDGFSLIPADPIAIIFWIVVLISLLVPTWTAPEPK